MSFIVIIFITIMVAYIAIRDADSAVKKEVERQNMSKATQMQSTFDVIFRQLNTINNYNYLNVDVQSFMNGDIPYGLYEDWGKRFHELTNAYKYIQDYIYDMGFYDSKNHRVWSWSVGSTNTSISVDKYMDSTVCDYVDGMGACESEVYYHLYANRFPHVLTLIKKNREGTGASFLSINIEKLRRFIPTESLDCYIIDENGMILYSNNREELGGYFNTINDSADWELLSHSNRFQNDSTIVSCVESKQFDWYYIVVQDNVQIGISKDRLYNIYLLACSICILGLFFSVISSKKAVRPLEMVLDLLNDGEIVTSQYSYSEMQIIAQKITGILSANKNLKVRLEKMLKEFDELQSEALQYQINPHFLYNTLNTASVYAAKELGPRHDTVKIIRNLSEILQYSLNYEDHIVGLDEELSYLRIYLSILEKRYREKFKIVWEIPDEILNSRIVRMSIQPLVENAVHHGIQPQGGGTIKIGGIRMNDCLMVWVSDNGVGMSREEIEEVKLRIDENKIQSKHIGLANVHRRLQIIFGKEYGVTVTPEFPKGVRTTITIPYIEESNKEN